MAKSTECKCNIPKEMAQAGAAAALCHHSDSETAEKVRQQLMLLIQDLEPTVSPEDMFEKPLTQVAEDYMKNIVGDGFDYRTPQENTMMMIAFLRHMSLGMQIMIASLVVEL